MTPVQILKIKKKFYNQLRSKVEAALGKPEKQLFNYEKAYTTSLQRAKPQLSSIETFFKEFKNAQIVIFGDFHTHAQSTKSILRVLREYHKFQKIKFSSYPCLALECFRASDQKWLDLFLSGELSETEFLKKINWENSWGFSWDNLKPLIQFALQNKVKIIGLNSPLSNLKKRDEFVARLISQFLNKNPHFKMFIQFGEFHLAPQHLPLQIKKNQKNLNLMIVHQSPENVYFKLMKKHKDLGHFEFVRLKKSHWAVMTVTPWVKWQDYLLYLEANDDQLNHEFDFEASQHVLDVVELLEKIFSVQLEHKDFNVFTFQDDIFFEKLKELPASQKKYYQTQIEQLKSFYIPEKEIAFLAKPTLNHVARLAALYFINQFSNQKISLIRPKEQFLQLIWLEALVVFLIKSLNPKKKADSLEDIKNSLKQEQLQVHGRQAIIVAIEQKMRENLIEQRTKNSIILDRKSLIAYSDKTLFSAVDLLGGILGEKFFMAFRKKLLKWPEHKKFIFKDFQAETFSQEYYTALEIIETWPLSQKSKYERF